MHSRAVPAPLPPAQLKAAERPGTASQILDLPRPDWLIEGSVTILSNGSLLQLFRTNRDRVYRYARGVSFVWPIFADS
jgi:hypothetical protein